MGESIFAGSFGGLFAAPTVPHPCSGKFLHMALLLSRAGYGSVAVECSSEPGCTSDNGRVRLPRATAGRTWAREISRV